MYTWQAVVLFFIGLFEGNVHAGDGAHHMLLPKYKRDPSSRLDQLSTLHEKERPLDGDIGDDNKSAFHEHRPLA